MVEEYQSIMKNDVWEIVPRTKGKSVVTSRWLYKIKHGADGSIEKHKLGLLLEDSLRKRESIMMRHMLLWLDILPSNQSLLLLQLWDGSCIR